MDKVRVTLRLDADVAAALKKKAAGSGLSATANEALRDALGVDEGEAHRRAARAWIDGLNEKYGHPSPEDHAWAKKVLDEARGSGTVTIIPLQEKLTSPDKRNF